MAPDKDVRYRGAVVRPRNTPMMMYKADASSKSVVTERGLSPEDLYPVNQVLIEETADPHGLSLVGLVHTETDIPPFTPIDFIPLGLFRFTFHNRVQEHLIYGQAVNAEASRGEGNWKDLIPDIEDFYRRFWMRLGFPVAHVEFLSRSEAILLLEQSHARYRHGNAGKAFKLARN